VTVCILHIKGVRESCVRLVIMPFRLSLRCALSLFSHHAFGDRHDRTRSAMASPCAASSAKLPGVPTRTARAVGCDAPGLVQRGADGRQPPLVQHSCALSVEGDSFWRREGGVAVVGGVQAPAAPLVTADVSSHGQPSKSLSRYDKRCVQSVSCARGAFSQEVM